MSTSSAPPRILTATATRQGTSSDNADGVAVHATSRGTVAAAIVDMIGHGDGIDHLADLLAAVIARTAARHHYGLPALLAARELVADKPAEGPVHDGVTITAVANPNPDGLYSRLIEDGVPVYLIAWTGDAEARTWDGSKLERVSTPETVGEQLRANGVPLDLAAHHDNWIRTSLRTAHPASVSTVEADARKLLVLSSDGVADQLPEGRFAELLACHLPDLATAAPGDLESAARALVDAVQADAGGYRDDATACLLLLAS